jgi:two-component system sensor histidine kinase HydH
MPGAWSIRLQTALVIALFLGSLATVLVSSVQTLRLPRREFEVRDRLREANQRMVSAAEPQLGRLQDAGDRGTDDINERLRSISNLVLADFPGVEGGFYLDAKFDRFAGYAFPTGQTGPSSPPRGDEPPPKEGSFILMQLKQSISAGSDDFQFDVRTVGPSRVAIGTGAVGAERPARLAAWTMFRLVSPETLESQLRRYQVSTGLALGGIALAVALTINLGRNLKRQRLREDGLRDDLRRAEHLAALGKLLAGVAHELRNPLAGIRSTAQLWERLPDTARSPDSLRALIEGVDRLNEIVGRLLYFSRLDNTERQPVSITSVLTETLDLLEAQASAQSVNIERDFDPGLPRVSGSASALRQVFLNLATNALQAMPQGGRLHCRTHYDRQADSVVIRFIDTGPGVPPNVRQHLFEPFFTTRADGTGLGLAICREIVLQHDGQIESEAGGPGGAFRVVLPVAR